MTKEQLATLNDDVRIPTELLLERLKELDFLPLTAAISEDGGVAFLWEKELVGCSMILTADIEIEPGGIVSASVIPYVDTDDGRIFYDGQDEITEVWEVEEEPPFEETLLLIRTRLYATFQA